MMEKNPTAKLPGNRTFSTALWILAVVAMVLVGAVGWVIWKRGEFDLEGARMGLLEPPMELGAASQAPADAEERFEPSAPSRFRVEASLPLPPAKMGVTTDKARERIAQAVALRQEGDMQGALRLFEQALISLPNHPLVFSEIALTYEAMGLTEKAAQQWEKIYTMGKSAGDYFTIARFKLSGGLKESGEESRRDAGVASRFYLDDVKVMTVPMAAHEGEKKVLQIAIRTDKEGGFNLADIQIDVFFFDLVDGKRVDQTTADPPQWDWRTEPVDWRDQSLELLEVVYFHPALSEEEKKEIGVRTYYGYIVKLYYRDELQDVRAEPRKLLGWFGSGQRDYYE